MSATENRPVNKIDWQNTIAATFISGLLLVVVFLCPWRVESTGELKWSPIYQQPLSYVQSYDEQLGKRGGSEIIAQEADIAYDILALEVFVFMVVGGTLYIVSSGSGKEE